MDDDGLVQHALVQESIRTAAQRLTILRLLDKYADFPGAGLGHPSAAPFPDRL